MVERLHQLGEDRHSHCRYGVLTPAWRGGGDEGDWEPSVMPLCTFALPEPCPPALKRQWGGAISLEHDCAVCQAFQDVPLDTKNES